VSLADDLEPVVRGEDRLQRVREETVIVRDQDANGGWSDGEPPGVLI